MIFGCLGRVVGVHPHDNSFGIVLCRIRLPSFESHHFSFSVQNVSLLFVPTMVWRKTFVTFPFPSPLCRKYEGHFVEGWFSSFDREDPKIWVVLAESSFLLCFYKKSVSFQFSLYNSRLDLILLSHFRKVLLPFISYYRNTSIFVPRCVSLLLVTVIIVVFIYMLWTGIMNL